MNLLLVVAVIGILMVSVAFVGIEITIYLIYEAINVTIRYLRKNGLTGLIAATLYFPILKSVGFIKAEAAIVTETNIYYLLIFIVCLVIAGSILGLLLNLMILHEEVNRKRMLLIAFLLGMFSFIPKINEYIYLMDNRYYSGTATVTFILTLTSVIVVLVHLYRARRYEQDFAE